MANIRFKNLESKVNDKTPVNVGDLKKADDNDIIYKDLKLDLTDVNDNGIYLNNAINSQRDIRDIETSNNLDAVINSVENWFRTIECSRLLNPELSFGVEDYLFEQATENIAFFIGNEIMTKLPFYEPRIEIKDCSIAVNKIEGFYIINLSITVPSLNNITVNLKGLLDKTGYTIL